jgi:hypothetical protein
MIIWRLCVYQLLEAGIERVMDWEMGGRRGFCVRRKI